MTGADHDEHTTTGWRTRSTAVGALEVPSQWIDDDRSGAVAVVRPETSINPNGSFRENAVLSVVDSAGDIVADSSNAIAEARAMVPWSHVVSVTPWPRGPFGRRMQFLYEYEGTMVAVTKFTGTAGGKRVDLTCSAGLDAYPSLVRTFDSIATFSTLESLS